MSRYVLKRLLLMIPIILGVSLVIFSILAMTPGDPGTIILGAGALPEEIEAMNHQLGYDLPFVRRYLNYIYDAFIRFDFGNSYATKQPVFEELITKIPYSFIIAFNAILFASLVGIPIGVLSAIKQYSLLDTVPTFMAMFLASAPAFWLGMMLMFFFSLRLGWFPTSGVDSIKNFILPCWLLACPTLHGSCVSHVQACWKQFVRTTFALSEQRVLLSASSFGSMP